MTSVVRYPQLRVLVNGTALDDATSARVSYGLNQHVAEAIITCRTMPAVNPLEPVVVKMDTFALPLQTAVTTRFTGIFLRAEQELFPAENTLYCRGPLARAEIYEAEVDVDMSRYSAFMAGEDVDYGSTDQEMISTILGITGATGSTELNPNIGGTGEELGTKAKTQGFCWRAGETGLSFIERLDQVCLGYRIFDTPSGTIVRQQVTNIPTTAALLFREGYDIFRANYGRTVIPARNAVRVEGWQGDDGKGWYDEDGKPHVRFHLSTGSNAYLSGLLTEKISSAMVEKRDGLEDGEGLTCEEVADWMLGELNVYLERVTFVTPRTELITAGDNIAITAARFGLSARVFKVQQVMTEITRQGQFVQTLECIAKVGAS